MTRTRTSQGKTNLDSNSRASSRASNAGAPQPELPAIQEPPSLKALGLEGSATKEAVDRTRPIRPVKDKKPIGESIFDSTPHHTPALRHKTADPAHEEDLSSNLMALKRCRHKLTLSKNGLNKYFRTWNRDHKAFLNRDDLAEGFKQLNLDFSDGQIDFLARAFDNNQSDSVEYHEFCETMELTDAEIMQKAGESSMIAKPSWMQPKGWVFTPVEAKKAVALKEKVKDRLHQSFGSDPTSMRRAFLFMDKDRVGYLCKEDFIDSMKYIGLQVDPKELDLLLSFYDNVNGDGGFTYPRFVENFEPEPVGSFNPFNPLGGIRPKNLKGTVQVRQKWNGSYGRDTRYKVMFPDLYYQPYRAESCPPDFSAKTFTQNFEDWRDQGKIVGKEYSGIHSRMPLPSQGGPLSKTSAMGSRVQSVERWNAPPRKLTIEPKPLVPRDELIKQREARFEERRKEILDRTFTKKMG